MLRNSVFTKLLILQISMSVRLVLTVVMRMQCVLTLKAATLVPVLLDILEMDRVVWVCYGDISIILKMSSE